MRAALGMTVVWAGAFAQAYQATHSCLLTNTTVSNITMLRNRKKDIMPRSGSSPQSTPDSRRHHLCDSPKVHDQATTTGLLVI